MIGGPPDLDTAGGIESIIPWCAWPLHRLRFSKSGDLRWLKRGGQLFLKGKGS